MIYNGDCLEILKTLKSNSVHSLVTDPPAGIGFMGKGWDSDKGGRAQWIAWMTEVMAEAMRVLKPGAHGLVWALPRTSHWTATALEDAGFEVREVVTHLFGTGFPKSLDVSKAIDKAAGAEREVICARQWQGWGTALKPASEHWILVRKPLGEKTVAANVLKHGTGGINIDGCRIEGAKPATTRGAGGGNGAYSPLPAQGRIEDDGLGRFPANLILDEEAAALLDEQSGLNCGAAAPVRKKDTPATTNIENIKPHTSVGDDGKSYRGDSGGASRFFYVAKASKADKGADNTHPTVKSTALMGYLIKLVTPPGGVVLDPFMGSGSTGVAAAKQGFGFVGIEQSPEYFEIASGRTA